MSDDTIWISAEDRSEGDFGGEKGPIYTQDDSNRDAYEL